MALLLLIKLVGLTWLIYAQGCACCEGIRGDDGDDGVSTTLVFRPGGTEHNNVYVTEQSLANATCRLNGTAYTIQFDFSFYSDSYVLQTVGPWRLAPFGTWVAYDEFTKIAFVHGTTLPYPPVEITGYLQVHVDQSATVCALNSADDFTEWVSQEATIYQTHDNTGPWLKNLGSGFVSLALEHEAALGQIGTVVNRPLVTNTVIVMYDISTVAQGTVPTNDRSAIYINTASAYVDPPLYPIILYVGYFFADYAGTAAADIPAAYSQGAIISDSVNKILYQSDGSVWRAVGGQQFIYLESVTSSVQSQLNAVKNVTGITYDPGNRLLFSHPPHSLQQALDSIASAIVALRSGSPIPLV